MRELGQQRRRSIGSASLALVLAAAAGCPPCSRSASPNVVLIVLDTTRVDRMSMYGYGRDTTPNLSRFAESALRFERAYATSTWTLASHASLFTGLLPVTHRATQENLRLDDELDTLAELLGGAGYQTAAFTNNSWISRVTNLVQGFDRVEALWRDHAQPTGDGLPHRTNTAVRTWLEARDEGRPFFLFINFMDPHWPYRAPDPYIQRFVEPRADQKLRRAANFPAIFWYLRGSTAAPRVLKVRSDLYDAEIAYLDAALGELFSSLRDLGIFDDALIVVTADHGENLGERGHQGHSFTLYDSTLKVPLLIRAPGGHGGGKVRHDPVQLTDVFATVTAAAGIVDLDPRAWGVDLLASRVPADRPVIGDYAYPKTFLGRFPKTDKAAEITAPFRRHIRSVQIGDDKLIWGSDGRHELYDMATDTGETNNVIDSRPERAKVLEGTLAEIVDDLQRPITQAQAPLSELDEETIENLRALGYLP